MIKSVKKNFGVLPTGTIIEFTSFDKEPYFRDQEKEVLEIGHHYIVEAGVDTDDFQNSLRSGGIVEIIVKGRTIFLEPYQYQIVKPVQKSTVQLKTDLFLSINDYWFYELSLFDRQSSNGVNCFIRKCNMVCNLGMLDCEILGFNIKNEGV